MRTLRFEVCEPRLLLSVSPDSLLVHIATTAAEVSLPAGYQLGWVGQSGFTKLSHSTPTIDAMEVASGIPGLDYVGLNPMVQLDVTPNDPLFPQLWGMIKIDAPAAWDILHDAPSVIIASIDTGVAMSHPDLAANIWTNAGEIPGNGLDDDGNGFVDDVNGWDFVNNDNNPLDDNSHGSHTSGTFGGEGNNALGVVGGSWDVQIMPIKVFNAGGGGSLGDIIQGIDYSAMMGAQISNNSWGGQTTPGNPAWQPLKMAIEMAGTSTNQLFVASAGNSNTNNDTATNKNLPAAWNSANIISVAASDQSDNKASFSSYGLTTIDLAAPGVSTLSSCLGTSYCTKSGTSMAAPHVSGIAALLAQQQPGWTFQQIKDQLMNTVDLVGSWGGLVASGGRLNALNALGAAPPPPPVNLPPVAVDDVFAGEQDKVLRIPTPGVLANDTDPNGDALTSTVASKPANGTVALMSDGSFAYTPNAGFTGPDKWTYDVSDGVFSDEGAVTILVDPTPPPPPPNSPPVGGSDFYTGKSVINRVSVLDNDSDPDGDRFFAILESNPASGKLVWFRSDGTFQYVAQGFSGTTTFIYSLIDEHGATSDDILVTLELKKPGGKPAASLASALDVGMVREFARAARSGRAPN